MIRSLKVILPAAIAGFGILTSANISYGKAEYTKKEKKGCAVCHVTATSKELNDVGKCYGKTKTLEGCATSPKK